MPIPTNFLALYVYEEDVRGKALNAIEADISLSDHIQAIHDALDHLMVLIRTESVPNSATHTLQLLAIRLLNNASCVVKLGLSGYYQVGFQLIREMLELANLVDLFSIEADKLERWRTADDKTMMEVFSPVKVRKTLEKHERFAGQRRDGLYKTFSSYAAHPTYKGFQLIAPDNSPKMGCFFDVKLLGALLYEAGRHLSHATIALSYQFDDIDATVLASKATYINQLRRYREKHIRKQE